MTYSIPRRDEFSKADKRYMLMRSEGVCEAEGTLYGLPKGQRCNASLGYGVHFDHVHPTGAGGPGKGHPENGKAVCPRCHSYKTNTTDKALVAKVKRVSDKHNGIRTRRHKWPARRMNTQHVSRVKQLVDGWRE